MFSKLTQLSLVSSRHKELCEGYSHTTGVGWGKFFCSALFCSVYSPLSLSRKPFAIFVKLIVLLCICCMEAKGERQARTHLSVGRKRKQKRWNGKVPELGRKNCVKTLYFADDDGIFGVWGWCVHHRERWKMMEALNSSYVFVPLTFFPSRRFPYSLGRFLLWRIL